MSHETGWSLDFCLSCDKQTSEGPYCSQTCRLADLGKGLYTPPYQTQDREMETSSLLNPPRRRSAYVLPPAFDFRQACKPGSKSYPSLSLSGSPRREDTPTEPRIRHHSFSSTSTTSSSASPAGTPWLGSSFAPENNASTTSSSAAFDSHYYLQLSNEARQQLQHYEASFDYTRYEKVRSFS